MTYTVLRGLFDSSTKKMTREEARVLYRWLSIPRYATIVVSVTAIAAFWVLHSVRFDPRPIIFGLVPGFLLVSAAAEVLIKRDWHPLPLLYAQLLLDLIGVTVGVLLTGGVNSPFALLYILVVISASLISVRTLVAFGVMTAVVYQGVVLAAADQVAGAPAQDPLTLLIFMLIVGLIAFQSNYYVSRIREKDEEVIKLKDEFLFRTIHDLRSPSTAIRYTLQKYKTDSALSQRPDFQQDLRLMEGAMSRMSLLIEDLLKIAAGDNPTFEVKQYAIDVRTIIREAATELAPQTQQKNVTLVYDPPADLPPVLGDAEKLKEVFNNFVDNAVKYNRAGGVITITHCIEHGQVCTDISDTGEGISERSLAKLFTPFFRGDVGSDVNGTGLGLYMTRKLLQKMQGTVTVRSVVAVGTTFTVRLPAAVEPTE